MLSPITWLQSEVGDRGPGEATWAEHVRVDVLMMIQGVLGLWVIACDCPSLSIALYWDHHIVCIAISVLPLELPDTRRFPLYCLT